MRQIKVVVEVEMRVPNDWQIETPVEGFGDHLRAGKRLLMPVLGWMELEGKTAEGGETWIEIKGGASEMELSEMVKGGSHSIELV